MIESHRPSSGSHDSTPAYACYDAAGGDPELALAFALMLLQRGLIRADSRGIHRIGRLPAELRAAA